MPTIETATRGRVRSILEAMSRAALLLLLRSVGLHAALALAWLAGVWPAVVSLVTLPDRFATARHRARAACLNAEADVVDADVRLLEGRMRRADLQLRAGQRSVSRSRFDAPAG